MSAQSIHELGNGQPPKLIGMMNAKEWDRRMKNIYPPCLHNGIEESDLERAERALIEAEREMAKATAQYEMACAHLDKAAARVENLKWGGDL